MLALLAQATDIPDVSNTVNSTAATGIIAGFGIFFLVFLLIGIVLWIFNLWMAIDCATRKESDFSGNNKTLWLILLIVGLLIGFGWIVALIYFFTIRKQAKNGGGTVPTQPTNTDSSEE